MTPGVAIDLMGAAAAVAWALTGARATRGMLRPALLFLLATLAALLVSRSLARLGLMADGWAILVALVLPLATLLCAEAVRGVHAPLAAKLAVTVLPVGVMAYRLVEGDQAAPAVWATAALVLGTLASVAWWLAPRRDGGERTRGRVGLLFAAALAIAAPLALTDFLPGLKDLRLGGLAVLLGVALGARLTSTGGDPRAALSLMLGALVLAGGTGLVLLAIGAIERASLAALFPVLLATLLLADVLSRSFDVAVRAEEVAFLRALASAHGDDPSTIFASLRTLPALRGASLLGPDELVEHDVPGLMAALAATGVLRAGDVSDPYVREEAAHLFALHDADHMLLVSREPVRVALARLGPEDTATGELRLRVLARVLALAGRGEAA